jgi:two-component system, cell cycle sensor histidine kinase and response regulator CckA
MRRVRTCPRSSLFFYHDDEVFFKEIHIMSPDAGQDHHDPCSGTAAEASLHDLRTYQIELEMQNEALRQSQLALAESRDRYRDLYEFAPVGYFTLDPEGKIGDVNLTAVSLLGKERKKLLQKPFVSLIDPEDQSRWVQHVLRMQQAGEQGDVTLTFQRSEERVFQARLNCTPVHGESAKNDGAGLRLRITMSDVTEQLEAERAMRVERSRMKTVLDVANDPIFVKDNEHRVILANRAFYELFGLDEGAVMGKTLVEHVPVKEREHFLAVDRRVLDTGKPDVREESLTLNGFERTIVTSKTRFVEETGQKFLVGTIFDLTERKQAAVRHTALEAQLRESQKMEAMGTLAGGIAHDFNNIVAAILGNAELARQDSEGNAAALESVEEIRKAASRARELVQQILSFSRRQPTLLKATALGTVIDETLRLMRATLPARIELEYHRERDVPMVLADANQIEQVLINLVTNAMQAMAERPGRIEIGLGVTTSELMLRQWPDAPMRLYAKRPKRLVRLTVKDDGPGIDGPTLERIFEPFFTTKPVGKGTGLGLSVAHGIVQKHEGAIQVKSQPGQGTTFTVYLSAFEAQAEVPADAKCKEPVESLPERARGKKILYVDDDGSLVRLMTLLLKRQGFQVTGYTDHAEALQELRTDPAAFDLVLTDYNMPGKSGLDVAREVRALNPNLPVAVISGFIDQTLLAQAAGAGVCELIFKAEDVAVLCESVLRTWQKSI